MRAAVRQEIQLNQNSKDFKGSSSDNILLDQEGLVQT